MAEDRRSSIATLPNLLGIFRIVATPVIMALLLLDAPGSDLAGGLLFLAAGISDFLDGWIARARDQVSPLGVFMDLAADKVLVAGVLIGNALGPGPWAGALAAVGAVVGHVRSIFIGFTGGRGAATGAGAMLVLAPIAILVALPEFLLIVWRTRLVSLGSVMAAVTVALVAAALYSVGWAGLEVVVAGALIGLVVVLAHTDNIQRLLAGTERRIGSG